MRTAHVELPLLKHFLGNFCLCFCLSVMILYQYTYAWKLDKSKNQKEIFRLTKAKYERV